MRLGRRPYDVYRRVRIEAGDARAELRCGGLVGHVRGQSVNERSRPRPAAEAVGRSHTERVAPSGHDQRWGIRLIDDKMRLGAALDCVEACFDGGAVLVAD